MTAVPPVQQSSNDMATQRSSATPTLDYDAFLQLLIAQMKNQDPTNPMSDTEYVAQLASFSNVEQNTKLNDKLALMIQQNSIDQGANLIGRTVSSFDGQISGVVEEVRIYSDGVTALLDNGMEVPVGPGLVIS